MFVLKLSGRKNYLNPKTHKFTFIINFMKRIKS